VTDRDDAARALILARLAESRAELLRLIDPPRQADGTPSPDQASDGFPRSRTMQMLLTGRGVGVMGAIAAGLFIARPALALRLLRMLPAGAATRIVMSRVISMLRAKQRDRRP
jgi:hypothetical protein